MKANVQPGQRLIGMVARLATEKGVEYLVEALPEVLQRFPTARVLHMGQYQNVMGGGRHALRHACGGVRPAWRAPTGAHDRYGTGGASGRRGCARQSAH